VSLGGIDDWMKSELRLAERQGLLRGRHLSPVQFNATVILHFQDDLLSGEKDFRSIKKALLSLGWEPSSLFPEYFKAQKKEAEEAAPQQLDPNAVYDYSDVEWVSPSSMGTSEEGAALLAYIEQIKDGSLLGDQVVVNSTQGWM
jgi:hypothetical protein